MRSSARDSRKSNTAIGPRILIACAILGGNIASARTGPCSDTIAQVEALVDPSTGNRVARLTAPQSIGAQLSHQPTPESVRRAEEDAHLRFASILAHARILDAEGKTTERMRSVTDAKRLLDLY
jgi:hypothetical protein